MWNISINPSKIDQKQMRVADIVSSVLSHDSASTSHDSASISSHDSASNAGSSTIITTKTVITRFSINITRNSSKITPIETAIITTLESNLKSSETQVNFKKTKRKKVTRKDAECITAK